MEQTIKLATCIFTFVTLLSEGLTVTSPPLLPASKRADWNSGQGCPPIIPSTNNHSTWLPVVHEGQDFHAWQQYTTTGYAKDLYAAWVRQPSALKCSQFNITTVVTDVHTINTSITVLDTRVDKNCSDEGIYLVLITSNCTFNDSIMFNMTFDKNDPCAKDIPPQPEFPKSVTVPEHRPDANESTTLCVSIRYFGSDNISQYDTLWLLGEQGSCNETDPNLLCEDDGADELGSVYTCNRMIFGDCTFLSDICISNYSRLNSGKYTTIACPLSGSDPIGSISQLELSVIGWPKLTKWPGSMVSRTVDEMEANLTYGLTNFSHNFINITFYNGSELIANLTHFAEGFKVVIAGEDNESTTIQLYIPAEGRYKMCYNFTDDVQWTGQSNFPPGYEVPNCTQYTHAILKKESTNVQLLEEIIPPSVLGAIMVLTVVVGIFYIVRKHFQHKIFHIENGEKRPLKGSSTPSYGSASNEDQTNGTGPLAAVGTMDPAVITPTSHSSAPLQEPMSSDQESKPTIGDVKPKLAPASSKHEKTTLFELKTEPSSPNKEDIKPEKEKPFSNSDVMLKDKLWLLEEIVAIQKEQILYQESKLMYYKTQQEVQTHGELASQITIKDEPPLVKSEPLLPSGDQAVCTYGDVTERTTEYLRGFESFAETSLVITGSHTFEWHGYGLKLHVSEGALPADHKECRIDIKAGLSGQFSFPDDSQLVSCVYWISCSQRFIKPVTLEIEHCAAVQDSSQSSTLRFVVAKCSQAELPYQFKELKQATFSPHTSFGSVQVSHFSFFGITWRSRCYCANIYYKKKSINEWRVIFVITWNLLGFQKAVESMFAESDDHFSMAVEFQDDAITLEVPVDGEVLENGWEITPLTPPTIKKSQVDCFQPGQQLPSCFLSVQWIGEDNPIRLKHRISLAGAKTPFNFFFIMLPEGLGKHRRQKQVEDHHNGKPKREKPSNEQILTDKKSLDIRTLTHELKGVTEWFQLGGQLGVRHDKLRQIEQDCSCETERCKTEMLNCWLQGDPEASWSKVVEALQRMDRVVQAQQLQKEYICLPNGDEDNHLRPPLPHETTKYSHLPSGTQPALAPLKDPLQ